MRTIILIISLFQVGCGAYRPAHIHNQSAEPIAVGSVWNQTPYRKIPSGKGYNVNMNVEPCFYIQNSTTKTTYNYSKKEYSSFIEEYSLGIKWRMGFDGINLFVIDKNGEKLFELEKYHMDIEVERFCTY